MTALALNRCHNVRQRDTRLDRESRQALIADGPGSRERAGVLHIQTIACCGLANAA